MRPIINAISYLADYSLSATGRRVRRENLTYLNVLKLKRLERALAELAGRSVPGEYLEFGVALGGSAIILAKDALNNDRAFHGFDVFSTIPPPASKNDDDSSRERYQDIASGRAKGINGDRYYGYEDDLLQKVKSSMARFGVPVDGKRIQLHQGLFEDTWPKVTIDKIAFAQIDCDWYDPVAYCLNGIANKMSSGGVVLIDDYNDYKGARCAVDEFRSRRA